ncbi:F-box protein At5g18160-like [Salvia hispanica]|uniref:F-box protein At5g18160-like n=1 Tax=Salvia hispanica TaxID=49212 RepID=UPI0020096AD0|nr:F-box protein At5g18160-like [Salvia hispanica]
MYTPKQGLPTYTSEPCLAFASVGHEFKVCDEAFKPLLRVCLPVPENPWVNKNSNRCYVIDSANGLLLVWNANIHNLSVCNPMTHEYTVLPLADVLRDSNEVVFGFGVSKISGQYKIFYGAYIYETRSWSCYVYTLGGRGQSWRSLVVPALGRPIQQLMIAQFLNGNLHWLTSDLAGTKLICCFDLETELFTNLSLPDKVECHAELRILEERLCFCTYASHIAIWRLNFYGDKNSWSKEYLFDNLPHGRGLLYPLKVVANGDLLYAARFNRNLFIYSRNTRTVVTNGRLQGYDLYSSNISFYTPSFVSLKAMGIHNVESLQHKIVRDSLQN